MREILSNLTVGDLEGTFNIFIFHENVSVRKLHNWCLESLPF